MYLSILFKTNQVSLILCHSCQYVCKQQSPLTRLKHLQLMLKERPDHFIARSSVHFQTRILWRQLSSFLWWPKLGGPQGSPSTGALLSAFDLRKLVENVPVAARCQALEKILPSKPCKVQNFIMSVHEVGYFGTLLWKEVPLSVQTTHASFE